MIWVLIFVISLHLTPTHSATKISHAVYDQLKFQYYHASDKCSSCLNQTLQKFNNTQNLTVGIEEYLENKTKAEDIYGPILCWDVSDITDMGMLFNSTGFNSDISCWNVSNVKNMTGMFFEATKFNQTLSNWDVSNVLDMSGMFGFASSFNHDISTWDVSSVLTMRQMFSNATKFNQKISTWDVSKVTDMNEMFMNAMEFNQDIKSWNVKKVENLGSMFKGATDFDQNLCDWGSKLGKNTIANDAFVNTGCPSLTNPNFSLDPITPLCHECSSSKLLSPFLSVHAFIAIFFSVGFFMK